MRWSKLKECESEKQGENVIKIHNKEIFIENKSICDDFSQIKRKRQYKMKTKQTGLAKFICAIFHRD